MRSNNKKKKYFKKSRMEGNAPLKEKQTAMDFNIAPEIEQSRWS